jgi:hypothetical protein
MMPLRFFHAAVQGGGHDATNSDESTRILFATKNGFQYGIWQREKYAVRSSSLLNES